MASAPLDNNEEDVLGTEDPQAAAPQSYTDWVLSNPDAFAAPPEPKGVLGKTEDFIHDRMNDAAIGIQQLPGIATGLGDMAAGYLGIDRPFDKAATALGEKTGFTPAKWAEQRTQGGYYSPEFQNQINENEALWAAKDKGDATWTDIGLHALQNPEVGISLATRSVPAMVTGAKLGQVVTKGSKMLAPLAPHIGEGMVMGGSAMDSIDDSVDPRAAALAATGIAAGGAAIGKIGGAVADRMGVIDPEKLIAQGLAGSRKEAAQMAASQQRGLIPRVGIGGAIETGEEVFQSGLETLGQNAAEQKPLTEGMGRSMFEGGWAGGVMGAGMNIPGPIKGNGPLSNAVNKSNPQPNTKQPLQPDFKGFDSAFAKGNLFTQPVGPKDESGIVPSDVYSVRQNEDGSFAANIITPAGKITNSYPTRVEAVSALKGAFADNEVARFEAQKQAADPINQLNQAWDQSNQVAQQKQDAMWSAIDGYQGMKDQEIPSQVEGKGLQDFINSSLVGQGTGLTQSDLYFPPERGLPQLPADEILTFPDGSQARKSEILPALAEQGLSEQEQNLYWENLAEAADSREEASPDPMGIDSYRSLTPQGLGMSLAPAPSAQDQDTTRAGEYESAPLINAKEGAEFKTKPSKQKEIDQAYQQRDAQDEEKKRQEIDAAFDKKASEAEIDEVLYQIDLANTQDGKLNLTSSEKKRIRQKMIDAEMNRRELVDFWDKYNEYQNNPDNTVYSTGIAPNNQLQLALESVIETQGLQTKPGASDEQTKAETPETAAEASSVPMGDGQPNTAPVESNEVPKGGTAPENNKALFEKRLRAGEAVTTPNGETYQLVRNEANPELMTPETYQVDITNAKGEKTRSIVEMDDAKATQEQVVSRAVQDAGDVFSEESLPYVQLKNNGKPFKTEKSANNALNSTKVYTNTTPETHEVVPVEGGFGLQAKAPAATDVPTTANEDMSDEEALAILTGNATNQKAPSQNQEVSKPVSKKGWDIPNENTDKWHGTRVTVAPELKGETESTGTVKQVFKGMTGPVVEVQIDGSDSTFRYTPDRLSVISSESTPENPTAKAAKAPNLEDFRKEDGSYDLEAYDAAENAWYDANGGASTPSALSEEASAKVQTLKAKIERLNRDIARKASDTRVPPSIRLEVTQKLTAQRDAAQAEIDALLAKSAPAYEPPTSHLDKAAVEKTSGEPIKQVIDRARKDFSFLLTPKEKREGNVSDAELADRIAQAYDLANPKTKLAYSALKLSAQENQGQNPEVEIKSKPRKKQTVNPGKDSLLKALRKLGGVSKQQLSESGIDTFKMDSFLANNKTKNRLDGIGQVLLDMGYPLDPGRLENSLIDLIAQELSGKEVYTPEGYANFQEAQEAQRQFDAEQQALFSQLSEKEESSLDDFENWIDNHPEDETDPQSFFDEYEDDIPFGKSSMTEKEAMDAMGFSKEEQLEMKNDQSQSQRGNQPDSEDLLSSYTEKDIKDREQRQKDAELADKKDMAEAERKKASDASVNTLVDEMLGGNVSNDIPGMELNQVKPKTEPTEKANEPSAEVKKAQEDYDKAMGQVGQFFLDNNVFTKKAAPGEFDDAALMPILARLMDAAIRLGYAKFKHAAQFVLNSIRDKFGDNAADSLTLDHLQGSYIAVAGKYKEKGTDSKKEVINVDTLEEIVSYQHKEEANAPNPNSNLESDRTDPGSEDGGNEKTVRNGRPNAGQDAGQGSESPEGQQRGSDSNRGVSADPAALDRERGDQPVHSTDPASVSSELPTGVTDRERGGNDGNAGILSGSTPDPKVKSLIEQRSQKTPTTNVVKKGDKANVEATVPVLTQGQVNDVLFAEKRFEAHSGVLFTNSTGTGKTFSGLGIIKRMVLEGKSNILIVTPSDGVNDQWVAAASKFFDLKINPLQSTKDKGQGVNITTFANFGSNNALSHRQFDAIIFDESHKLMHGKDAKPTDALHAMRAATGHERGFNKFFEMQYPEEIAELKASRFTYSRDMMDQMLAELRAREEKAIAAYNRALEKAKADYAQRKATFDTKIVFLSASPFAYVLNIDYAEGYLFNYGTGDGRQGYNSQNPHDQFYIENFGYRMRTGKLTQPEASVNSGLMEREFNAKLRREGALSHRELDVEFDYDRKFVQVDSTFGRRIDEALEWIREQGFLDLHFELQDKFGTLQRRFLLEGIKAQAAIDLVKKNVAMGRKVVVFHDYKVGGATNPFKLSAPEGTALAYQIEEFNNKFGDLVRDFSAVPSPIDAFTRAFGEDVLLYNGDVSKSDRAKNIKLFNQDGSGKDILLAQSASAKEGVSMHDTTGQQPRVLINLGLPTAPTTAIQQEGRIFRVGQASNAMIRYMNTGTNWERWAFATTMANRAATAENLGAGEGARGLRDSFVSAFENSDTYPPGHEGEGQGGKAFDRQAGSALTEYDRAKTFYFSQQQRTSRTKSAEGTDYYATPEPIGVKLVQFADIRRGDHVLEPSAGHGAIARWIPENVTRTAMEPSGELSSKLAIVFDGAIKRENFEDLHINNKFDSIVMNPPYGKGGATAIAHLKKAYTHLRDGGRIVAVVPQGPAFDSKFNAWMESDEAKKAHIVAEIKMPQVTFKRAGTQVWTKIVVIDKTDTMPTSRTDIDLMDITDINDLFDRMETMEIPERSKAKQRVDEGEGAKFKKVDYEHTKTKEIIPSVKTKGITEEAFKDVKKIAKNHEGYYNTFAHMFFFKTEEARESFLEEIAERDAEVRFSQYSKVPNGKLPKGIPVEEAQKIVDEFMAEYNGLIPLEAIVVKHQSNIYGRRNKIKKRGVIKGAYHPFSGKIVLIAANLDNAEDGRSTLRHEILAHFGLNTFAKDDKRAILDQIIRSAEEPSLKLIWDEVNERYDDKNEDVRAEEVLARLAEEDRNVAQQVLDKIVALIKKALRRIGLLKGEVSRAELRVLLQSISDGIKNGTRLQQNFPQADDVLFSLTPKGNYPGVSENESERYLQEDLFKPTGNDGAARSIPTKARTVPLRDNAKAEGQFATRVAIKSETKKDITVDKINTPYDAAQAVLGLGRIANEQFYAIVTDQNGKPLAITGSFKGTIDSASVYPAVVTSETYRVKGAKHVWFVHNHPSGTANLSDADRRISKKLQMAMAGSAIQAHGILAVTPNGQFDYEDPLTNRVEDGWIELKAPVKSKVSVVAREIDTFGQLGDKISTPDVAKKVIPRVANGESGIVLMDNQNAPVGFIRMPVKDMLRLKNNGRMDDMYRAVSISNAASAMIYISNSDPVVQTIDSGTRLREFESNYQNVGTLLKGIDIRVLDALIEEGRFGVVSAAENRIETSRSSGVFYSRAKSSANELDQAYFDALERGDEAEAQRLVNEAAERAGVPVFGDDSQNIGYKIRRSAPPKKTVKVYKAFRLRDGKLYPMFVGAKDDIPIGQWMDATEGGYHFTADNGREYIPADTGVSVPIPNEEVRQELLKRGYIKSPTAKSIKVVAYRPGWHGGELPFFPQAGNKVIHKGKKLIDEAPDDYAYPNVHEYDTVIAEVEMDADYDYKQEYLDTAERNADGSINKNKSGLRNIPKGGFYEYATNPLFKDRPDLGKWYISGSVKINKILTQEEVNKRLDALNVPRQLWNKGENTDFDQLNLDALGYDPQFNHASYKLLDVKTYDDNGNIIPLSERFNLESSDPRFSQNTGAVSGSSVADVESWLTTKAKKMLGESLVVVQSVKDLPMALQKGSTEGLYDPASGKTYLVADLLTKENVHSVFAHEMLHKALSEHPGLRQQVESAQAGLRDVFDKIKAGKYAGLYQDLYQQAMQRVNSANTPEDQQFEEFLAYTVTAYNENQSLPARIKRFVEQLISAVKKLAVTLGVPVSKLTPADLHSLAMQAVNPQQGTAKDSAFAMASQSPRYSTASPADMAWGTFKKGAPDMIESFWRKTNKARRKASLSFLSFRQLTEVANELFKGLTRDIQQSKDEMEAMEQRIIHQASLIYEKGKKLSKEERKVLGELAHLATFHQISADPKTPFEYTGNRVNDMAREEIMAELQDRFKNELSSEGQSVYREMRDFYQEREKERREGINNKILEDYQRGIVSKGTLDTLDKLWAKENQLKGDYFPLSRFGDYWISYENQDGQSVMETFDTQEEGRDRITALGLKEGTYGFGMNGDKMPKLDGVSPGFIDQINTILGRELPEDIASELQDAVYQSFLATLPNLSGRKTRIHRKNVLGYSDDVMRAFAYRSTRDAKQNSRITHAHKLRRLIDDGDSSVKMAESPKRMKDALIKAEAYGDYINDQASVDELERRLDYVEGDTLLKYKEMIKIAKDFEKNASIGISEQGNLQSLLDRYQMLKRKIGIAEHLKTKDDSGRTFAANIIQEMKDAYVAMMEPSGSVYTEIINNIGFVQFLGASPGAAFINALQTPAVAVPYVAGRYGLEKTTKAFLAAYEDFVKGAKNAYGEISLQPNLKNKREEDAFQTFFDRGLFSRTMAHDMIGAGNKGVEESVGLRQAFNYAAGGMFQFAERVNREITAMAAYRLAYEDLSVKKEAELRRKAPKAGDDFIKAQAQKEAHAEAISQAIDDTWATHGDYSASNRARVFRGNIARIATQFKQYSQFISFLYFRTAFKALPHLSDIPENWPDFVKRIFPKNTKLTKEEVKIARNQLRNMLIAQTMFSGTAGLPLGIAGYTLLAAIVEGFAGDDDEPFDLDAYLRKQTTDLIGGTATRMLAHGLLSVYGGPDIHSRLSQADLWIRESDLEAEGKDQHSKLLNLMAGPVFGGILGNIATAYELSNSPYDGSTWRGVEKVLPKAIGDVMKALRYSMEDATTLKGDLIQETTVFEEMVKALGLAPAELNDRYQQNNVLMRMQDSLQEKRTYLIQKAAVARRKRDNRALKDIWNNEIKPFNQHWRGKGDIPIKMSEVIRSAKGMTSSAKRTNKGIILNKRYEPFVGQYNYLD